MQEDEINIKKNFFSKMTEEETNEWLKKLNLEENILNEILKLVKNGKDLLSLYNNNQLLEKLNLDLHNINIINDAIEASLEEQLKINIINYLEKLMQRKIFLSPKSNSNEILNPNTLIQKKIVLNPDKYCYLTLFNENIIPKQEININNNKTTPNINMSELINDKKDTNTNTNTNKAYTSLFQNKKKNLIADFNTDYQMPSLNNNNNNNNTNDFKYQNLLNNNINANNNNNRIIIMNRKKALVILI